MLQDIVVLGWKEKSLGCTEGTLLTMEMELHLAQHAVRNEGSSEDLPTQARTYAPWPMGRCTWMRLYRGHFPSRKGNLPVDVPPALARDPLPKFETPTLFLNMNAFCAVGFLPDVIHLT